jgi:hypothetical protein
MRRLVQVLTALSALYGAVFLLVQWTGWGPPALHENGGIRSASIWLFYLSCIELLLSIPLERWAQRHEASASDADA